MSWLQVTLLSAISHPDCHVRLFWQHGSRPFSILYTAFLIQESRQPCASSFVTLCHNAKKDIFRLARACLVCQTSKVQKHTNYPVQVFEAPSGRFGHVHVDIVGPLLISQGCRYLFTMVDHWTRWPEADPMTDITAESCVSAMMSGWIARFGNPEVITTDRGQQFTSGLWQSFVRLLGSFALKTTSYHPQANGMVERFHRSFRPPSWPLRTMHREIRWKNSLRPSSDFGLLLKKD